MAIQLNDTHPTMSVPELMRILLDEARLGWEEAWDITTRTLAYTNHTLLPEALETWPVVWFEEMLLPRHLEIIDEINRRLVMDVRAKFPGDEGRVQRYQPGLVDEDGGRKIRQWRISPLSRFAQHQQRRFRHSLTVATHTHSQGSGRRCFLNDSATRRTASRRAAGSCWPIQPLARVITGAIGDGWITNLAMNLVPKDLGPLAEDEGFREAFLAGRNAKQKVRFADWLKASTGQVVDPGTIFDCQIKRIHEYKRQLLNLLRIVVLYNRFRANPGLSIPPRTFFFAGKAAPAYHLAKVIIKFINNLAGTIDGDPAARGKLKVVFLPEYSVSMAGRLIPCQRCFQPDLDRGLRSQRHQQHEGHAQWRAHPRPPGRGHD